MKWYDKAVFYHIYPLGFADVKKRTTEKRNSILTN